MDRSFNLTLFTGSEVTAVWSSGECKLTIGADPGCDVVIQGDGTHPRHTTVWLTSPQMQLEDLGTALGTQVNGYAVSERVQIDYPASVQIGDTTLLVELTPSDVPVQEESAPAFSDSSLDATVPSNRDASKAAAIIQARKETFTEKVSAPISGEYQLVREIARGGMGMIFQGEDAQLERQVAVKVSSLSYGGTDPRFEKEAKVLAHLAHPNIVPIYAIGQDSQGRPFYSMKLVKGRTLQAVLHAIRDNDVETTKQYNRERLLTVFRKICDAMAFAHAKGIIHRDLKPENVMVGEFGEVLVMDWGLAKGIGEAAERGASTPTIATTDFGMTMEGEVMGTPQYMSPEQAQGMVAELDERSDVYSLGGILYAILTLRPPIDGSSLEEVLGKVKSGGINSMSTRRGKAVAGRRHRHATPDAMGTEVPKALEAVTLKAMSLDRDNRYPSVEVFAGDIEFYQNGFATSAEHASAWKRARLWMARNKALTASATILIVMASGFTTQVVREGRRARAALLRLKETAPTFAQRANDALRAGNFAEALKSIEFAVDLEPTKAEYHGLRGNILQVLGRWPEAVEAYREAVQGTENPGMQKNLILTEELIVQSQKEGEGKAKRRLYNELNEQNRQAEAMVFAKDMKDFWKESKTDPAAILELVKQLESKLLPVPGTEALMSKTEFTVGEWKLYLRAEGLPEWSRPKEFAQTDQHPVVNVSWNQAKKLCDWLSKKTGRAWRMPTDKEFEAAVGSTQYPWGDSFPPNWDEGNYAVLANGKLDPERLGADGIYGTAPVASFKPNLLGFYDLGGNVSEYSWDGLESSNGNRITRGGGWDRSNAYNCSVAFRSGVAPDVASDKTGFRMVLLKQGAGQK